MTNRTGWIIAVAMAVVMHVRPGVAQTLYWTDDGGDVVQRGSLAGVVTIVSAGLVEPRGIALDVASEHVYWADRSNGNIRRASLDGSGTQTVVSGLNGPAGIALDLENGRIYWVEMLGGRIARANLDGTMMQPLINGVPQPFRIALDVAGGKMYWTDGPGMHSIRRANLDGSSPVILVQDGLSNPRGLALDVAAGKMYWADFDFGLIQRADLDGSNVETITGGQVSPSGLALDLPHGHVYWTNLGTSSLVRAKLDGSDVETLAVTGLLTPRDIAVDSAVVTSTCVADVDGSGAVGFTDLVRVLNEWGPCP